MSLAAEPIAAEAVAAQPMTGTSSTSKPPRKRTTTALADTVLRPEPR